MKKANINPKKVEKLYWKEELPLREIAKRFNICMATIRKLMVKKNIPRRESKKHEVIIPKEELKKLYSDNKIKVEKIIKKYNISWSTLYRWMKKYNINPKRRMKYKKYSFSGDNREKAYILGLVLGDLYACKHYRQIMVGLSTTHPAMINIFNNVFQKYGKIKTYLEYNKITKRYGWKAYVLLDNSFKFMLSKNVNIDNENFYYFLAGFFDCEGCLFIYNNHNYVGLSALIYNSNKELLDIIKLRLERDGFHPKLSKYFEKNVKTTNGYYRKCDLWTIRLHTIKEVLDLMNIMPIKHKEKLDKLNIAMSRHSNKWEEVSEQVNNLRMNIKNEVKEYINPLSLELK